MKWLKVLSDFFTIRDLIFLILGAGIIIIILIKAVWFIFRREKRFFNNLKKKIIIFAPPKSTSKDSEKPEDMQMELDLLRKTHFFPNLPGEIFKNTSHNNLQAIKKDTLVIVGYNKTLKEEYFLKILNKAKEFNVPLILYGYNQLEGKGFDEIKKYPHHSMCETGLRLVNDVFTTLATYPYGN